MPWLAGSAGELETDGFLDLVPFWPRTLLLEVSPKPELCLRSHTVGFQILVKIWKFRLFAIVTFFLTNKAI